MSRTYLPYVRNRTPPSGQIRGMNARKLYKGPRPARHSEHGQISLRTAPPCTSVLAGLIFHPLSSTLAPPPLASNCFKRQRRKGEPVERRGRIERVVAHCLETDTPKAVSLIPWDQYGFALPRTSRMDLGINHSVCSHPELEDSVSARIVRKLFVRFRAPFTCAVHRFRNRSLCRNCP